ncbi:MAG TPA: BON domain-containing protein, partial [Acidobacteriaceae bacterium]|nr:BON domain-containing protein [Acidobacteriaceae bacterium]
MIFDRKYRTISRLVGAVALAVLLASSAFAPAQDTATAKAPKSTTSDALVQANVLKALASAPDLANQSITTSTVFGVVTLSGAVQTEAQRTEAENLAARAQGVQKVVDELALSPDAGNAQPAASGTAAQDSSDQQQSQQADNAPPPPPAQEQNPAPIEQAAPEASQPSPNEAAGPDYGPGAPEYRQP